ncbi:AMP-binding protein [Variovorax ginsengisoli]|uniref:Long-chain acyl-CoA synthetase n=1 Tax=Variovorax ginsengisoli TaxID=363844 RepID=A0ABT9SCB2_9BURK|nr:AMP-binding protein [Variovorax ginsengisoli]MDP9901052.1 long-chain acyl-CoA synthetase [Variovorax ginsengisoli]
MTNPLDTWLETATAQPEKKPFWYHGDRELGYGDFLRKIAATHAWFDSLGARPGQRVLLATDLDQELLALLLGAWSAALTVVVVNAQSTGPEMQQAVRDVEPDFILTGNPSLFDAGAIGRPCPVITIGVAPAKAGFLGKLLKARPAAPATGYPAELAGLAPARQRVPVDAGADALVLYSSGTTGLPKGMVLSFAAIHNNLKAIGQRMGYGPDCRIHNSLPLHHADGLLHGPLLVLCFGATLVRSRRFSMADIEEYVGEMYRRQITHLVTVPVLMGLIHQHASAFEGLFQWPGFRTAVSTAGPLDETLWARVEQDLNIRLCNVYGLSETTIAATISGPDDASHRRGTVGTPLTGVEVVVRAPDGTTVPDGSHGEVFIRSNALFSRYLHQPEATAAVLVDGWMKTGDLGYRAPDGTLSIVGRIKNIVIKGGENINPEEVGARLLAHPGIHQAQVLGLPDARFGETLVAAVVLGDAALSDAEILAHCASHLSAAKLPAHVIRFTQLPLGPSGKVQREVLKALCIERLLQARQERSADSAAPEVQSSVLRLAEQVFQAKPDSITLDSAPDNTLGWDSLGHLNFITAVEGRFGIHFSAVEMMRLANMRLIVELARDKVTGRQS